MGYQGLYFVVRVSYLVNLKIILIAVLVFAAYGIYEHSASAQTQNDHVDMQGRYVIGEAIFEDGSTSYEYFLFHKDEQGKIRPYSLKFQDPSLQSFDLSGKEVRVSGYMRPLSSNSVVSGLGLDVIDVVNISRVQQTGTQTAAAGAGGVGGAVVAPIFLNSITLLNKFNGDVTEPHPNSYFVGRFYNDVDSLAAYWSDSSYGQLTLTGTVEGWRELPKTQVNHRSNFTFPSVPSISSKK